MYTTSDLRKGLKIQIDGEPWEITEFDFCKPGKGTALYRCKLKNMMTGATDQRTYRPNDRFEKPDLAEVEATYMYNDGINFIFSNDETFEEIWVNEDILGDQVSFLEPEASCTILTFNGKPMEITLPYFIEKEVVETEPGVRGDTATNVQKSARIDNGYEVMVPLFVNQGDVIKIDTRTGEYVERVSKA